MKILGIILSFFLFSCGGDSATAPAKQDTVPQKTAPAKKQVNRTNNGSFATAEQIAEAEFPVYGKGKADFTLKVEGAQPGLQSDLIGFYAEQNFKADQTQIQPDGTIRFNCQSCPDGQKSYQQGLYYVKLAEQKYLQIILGDDQQFTMTTKIADPDGQMQVQGSDDNQAFFENLKFERIGSPKFDAINKQLQGATKDSELYKSLKAQMKVLTDERKVHLDDLFRRYPNTLFTSFKKAGQEPNLREDKPADQQVFYYQQDFWTDVDWSDRRLLRTPVINNKVKRYFEVLTQQNQDSIFSSATRLVDKLFQYPEYYMFIANWVVRTYEPTKTTLMDPEFVHVKMIQKYFTRERAFWSDSLEVFALQQRAGEMAQSLIGDIGPNVISKDLQGKTHKLMDSKADYLIVYMFSPSCEHCQEQTPLLVDWYNKNKGTADVYAIALDTNIDDPNELANYIKKTNMPFPCVWDPTNRSIYAKYYVDITPEIYVMNKERKIIGKNLKVFQIDTIIDRDKEKKNK